ncbi:MAG: hypothetical protein LBR07_06205 [Puniceicoccales bacterium]|jgi:Tfp pilus assembly protein PilX|nr:hypothetical protein [Puniceicoccales bacterium]
MKIPAPTCRPSRRQRAGFALVIALVMMAMLLVLVISLVMFLALELRFSTTAADRQVARLNALYSLRLAVAQLQQEAGPDQRVTAQANITIPTNASSIESRRTQLRNKWKDRNPYYTGVWNTRTKTGGAADDQTALTTDGTELPPAWLVSGEKQFNTPAYASNTRNYEDGYKTPWITVRDTSTKDVILFRALPANFKSANDYERFPFDTRVTAAKVAIKDGDNNTVGNFAYWVADEGVKARLNMQNVLTENARDFYAQVGTGRFLARSKASGRTAFELFPEWDTLQSDDEDIVSALTTASYAAHKKLDAFVQANAADEDFSVSISNLYAHDVTAYSQGLMTDVRHGGLKWDLSLALELSWNDFKKTAFYGTETQSGLTPRPRQGVNATLVTDATTNWGYGGNIATMTGTIIDGAGAGTIKNIRLDPTAYSMPTTVTRNPQRSNTCWPVYTVDFTETPRNPTSSSRAIRGPAWNAMRDFYRLYKTNADGANDDLAEYDPQYASEVQNFVSTASGEMLAGRVIFPNVLEWNAWGVSHIAASDSVGNCDLWTSDYQNGGIGGPTVRVLKVSTAPYNSRYVNTLGLSKGPDKQLRLVVIPAFSLHNPFNVPIYYRGGYIHSNPYMGTPNFSFTVNGRTYENLKYIDKVRPNLYIMPDKVSDKDRIIPSGQTILFSPETNGSAVDANPLPGAFAAIQCYRGLRFKDGVYVGLGIDMGEENTVVTKLDFAATLSNYMTNGYFVREHVISWGRDISAWRTGSANSNSGDPSNKCSELTEQFCRGFSYACAGRPMTAEESQNGKTMLVPDFPNQLPFAAVEYFEKPADWSKAFYGEEQAVNNGYPLWTFSNPLAPARRPDTNANLAQAYSNGSHVAFGYRQTSPSWHFRYRSASSAEEAIEVEGGVNAFGGSSFRSTGQTQYVTAFIPRSPLLTVGQFRTAMLDLVDHRPLYTTGESFPSFYVRWDCVYETGGNAGPSWTNYDIAYMMNLALWDRFFFSTIAPDVDPRTAGAPIVRKKQTEVWDAFRDKENTGKSIPLANQHFVYNANAKTSDAEKILTGEDAYDSYRKSAAFLFQNGTFNINATSELAWRCILGATRELPAAYIDSKNPSSAATKDESKGHTIFNRVNPVLKNDQGNVFAVNNSLHNHVSWRGVKALTDEQIKKLAKAIVEKVRERQTLKPFEVPYRGEGETLCRPFFSLAEFINRTLWTMGDRTTGYPQATEAETRKGRVGVLQAAIYYADKKLGAAINTGMKLDNIDLGINSNTKLNEPTQSLRDPNVYGQGNFPYHANVNLPDNDNILMASAALGNLLQGDILETIGARISARSDTFTIRAYGDTTTAGNASQPRARAYVEAVVQRTPEYVDSASNEAFIHPQDNMNTGFKVENKLNLTALNKHLGRRFRIVSMRWLTEKDL